MHPFGDAFHYVGSQDASPESETSMAMRSTPERPSVFSILAVASVEAAVVLVASVPMIGCCQGAMPNTGREDVMDSRNSPIGFIHTREVEEVAV
jgi:hypothetical protein